MRRAMAWAALAGALIAGRGTPAQAGAMPVLAGSMGSTFGATDAPGEGGLSLALAALWTFEGPLSFGPMVFVDDFGTELGRLVDPNDGTDLGAAAFDHGLTYGAAWRLDATARGLGGNGAWRPFASATWGVYRLQGDRLGIVNGAVSATGASVGAGLRFVPGGRRETRASAAGLGLSVRHHRVFDDPSLSYTSAAVDWSWPLGAGAPQTAGK